MARIPMTSGFTLIPEGTYVFRVYAATYDEEFGKIEVKLVNAAGMTHTERFSIKDKNDELNEKALNAFSYFAKTAMNDFSLEDVDPSELVDHFICAEVVHTNLPSNKDPTGASLSPTSVTSLLRNTSTPNLWLVRSLSARKVLPLLPRWQPPLLPLLPLPRHSLRRRRDSIWRHCLVKRISGRGTPSPGLFTGGLLWQTM